MIFSLTSPIHTLNDREELQEPKDSLEKLCGGRGFGLLSRHLFFYLGSGFGLLSGGAFLLKVGGGLRLNSEGAARELKYRNPGDKSIGAVFPDVPPAAPILSDVRPVPSHPPTPPSPPPPNPTFPPPFSEIPLPKNLRETFFVDISSWFPRLDLPTGENSRGRRWLLESARVAPRSPESHTHPRRFGCPRFRNFHAQNCFKTRRFFENHDP